MMEVFTVITGDIIDSRGHDLSTAKLQEQLEQLDYPTAMLTNFKVLKGDELQGILRGFLPVPGILRRLRYQVYPCRVRLGIGVGSIEEGLGSSNSWEMNGPAFFRAREALNLIKESKLAHNNTVVVSSNQKIDLAVNTILLMIDTIQDSWTENQWEARSEERRVGKECM